MLKSPRFEFGDIVTFFFKTYWKLERTSTTISYTAPRQDEDIKKDF